MSGASGTGVRSGLVGRHEESDRAVAGGQVLLGDLLDLLGRDLLDAVAVEEVEPPVALRGPSLRRMPIRLGRPRRARGP